MPTPTLISLDTETGGLDERINPLLSIAIVVADETYQMMDGFEIKVAPPQNAFLEIPTAQTCGLENKKKQISGYMNVWTKVKLPSLPPDAMLITAYAAEVNGYIGKNPSVWDGAAIDAWNASAQPAPEAEADLLAYLTKAFGDRQVVTVAHNAIFDIKFVQASMPLLFKKLVDPWFCTCNASRDYFKKRGQKGSAKLVEMAKLAGHDYKGKAHQAYADCTAALAVLRFLKASG